MKSNPVFIQQGELNAFRSAILEILTRRLNLTYQAGKVLEKKVNTIQDVSLLRRLLVEATMVTSPEGFTAQLQA